MGLFDFFKKKESQTALDQVNEFAIKGFRNLANINNCAPSSKISDEEMIKIMTEVGQAFRAASIQREERIVAGNMFMIIFTFFQFYEQLGEEFYAEHLRYEIDKYLVEGLREDYKKDLKLF
jgi:hypothetical protein